MRERGVGTLQFSDVVGSLYPSLRAIAFQLPLYLFRGGEASFVDVLRALVYFPARSSDLLK